MQRDEFVKRVRELGDRSGAEGEIKATFATSRERLASNEPNNLASQIPSRARADAMVSRSSSSTAGSPTEKESVDESQAIRHARAVALVLQEAVTTGEMDNVRGQLKPEYGELFSRPGE